MTLTGHTALLHVKEFAAIPGEVRHARRFLAGLLNDCPAADDAITVVSELATNCVLHSASSQPGGTFTIAAARARGGTGRTTGPSGTAAHSVLLPAAPPGARG